MASKRKIKVQKSRLSRRRKKQAQARADRKVLSDKKQRQRAFRRGIKEALGFDNILSNLKKKPGTLYDYLNGIKANPCKEIPLKGWNVDNEQLDWNGAVI